MSEQNPTSGKYKVAVPDFHLDAANGSRWNYNQGEMVDVTVVGDTVVFETDLDHEATGIMIRLGIFKELLKNGSLKKRD